MKKLLIFLLTLISIISILSVTSCDKADDAAPECAHVDEDFDNVCDLCSEIIDDSIPHEHVFNVKNTDYRYLKSEATCSLGTVYYFACVCGEYSVDTYTVGTPIGHDYTRHEPKEPTCSEVGWNLYLTCNRCDLSSYKEIATLPHNTVSHEGLEATCEHFGWNEYETCTDCDYTTFEEIPALPHNTIYHEAYEATCIGFGCEAYETCSNCSYTTYSEYLILEDGKHKVTDGTCVFCGTKESSKGLTYTLNSDKKSYTVTGIGNFCGDELVIGIYNNLSVTAVGEHAFESCNNVKTIVIDRPVKALGSYAFASCHYLEEIYLYSSLSDNCGNSVFSYVGRSGSGITVTIGKNVKSIPDYMFYDGANISCSTPPPNIKNVIFEEESTCESIGRYAFSYCYDLISITIPKSIISIGEGAFYNTYRLIEVINNSNLDITQSSYGLNALDVHSEESKITNINDYLFYTKGEENYLLSYIGEETELTLPDNYNGENYQIYKYAFSYSPKLKSIIISNGVIAIGDSAFYYCSGLNEIIIPSSVINIGNYLFSWNCKASIYCEMPSQPSGWYDYWISNGNTVVYGYTGSHGTTESGLKWASTNSGISISGYSGTNKNVIIPEKINDINVVSISDSAFYDCTSLTSVTIPDSVTSIGDWAFAYCSSLTSVTIGDSVTSIGDSAFQCCTNLTSITIGDSVTSIGSSAFYYCSSLTSVTIGDSVTSIGDNAFSRCTSLTTINYKGTSSQWNAISKGYDWNFSTGSYTINYNYKEN